MIRLPWRNVHAAADRVDRLHRGLIGRIPPLERAWVAVLDFVVARQADRRYLTKNIFPAIVHQAPARVIFIGVRGYTRPYVLMFKNIPTEFWTCDIDPDAAQHGAPNRHVTEDVRQLDRAFPPGFFDVALLNGVFGWGIDRPDDMEQAALALAAILAPNGALLIGWNTDRSPDPDSLGSIAALFEPAGFSGLPHRMTFPGATHVFAWYRKKAAAKDQSGT